MPVKECPKCLNTHSTPQSYCPDCKRKYELKYRRDNKEQIKANRRLRRKPKPCNCHSYNASTGSDTEIILDPNLYFKVDAIMKTVCIDACIVEQIKMLWRNNIWTQGCCCGHNLRGAIVYLGIDMEEEALKAKELLKKHDPKRKWLVIQLKWVEVK